MADLALSSLEQRRLRPTLNSDRLQFIALYNMAEVNMNDRRTFLAACALSAGATVCRSSKLPASPVEDAHPIAVFAKPVEHLEFDELGKRLKSIGVQGIEATLRRDGQVSPSQFPDRLEQLVDALAKHDQKILIGATDINDISEQSAKQLELFARLGIRYFRMSYFRYDFSQPVLPQLEQFARQAADLAGLCKSVGITALYQNHAGKNYVGAALWDLQRVLQGIDPQHLAVALDIRHTALELATSWQAAYAALRPNLGAIYIKDFSWINNEPQNVPLGEGKSKPLFEQIMKDGLIGPLSLHVEYFDHRDPALQEQRWHAVEQDVTTLRSWMS
jgi:sugar phosphate isomerase/epimerase